MKKLSILVMLFLFIGMINIQAQTVIKDRALYSPTVIKKDLTIPAANKFTELSFAIFNYTSIQIEGDNYYLSPVSGVWGIVKSYGVETETLKTTNAYFGVGIGTAFAPFNFTGDVQLQTGKTPLTLNFIGGYQVFSATIGYDCINKRILLGAGIKISFIDVLKHKVI